MTGSVWLIAWREVKTYVGTASFWIALVTAPLMLAAALGLAHLSAPPMAHVRLTAPPAEARSLADAIVGAGHLEGRTISVDDHGPGPGVSLDRDALGRLSVRFDDATPLTAPGRMLVVRTLERDLARTGRATPGPDVRLDSAPVNPRAADLKGAARFGVALMLWLTLAGSLGMLLQAIVRERASRALESLLASVRPWEVVAGKLAGVGLVSAVVVSCWLGTAAGVGALGAGVRGTLAGLLQALNDPKLLLSAVAIYPLAFAFYGLVTLAIGARARDTASAQNLARPMFAMLLGAFFATLSSTGAGPMPPTWLVYAPPFAPFLLLTRPQPWAGEALAIGLLAVSTVVAAWLAVRSVDLDRRPFRLRKTPATV